MTKICPKCRAVRPADSQTPAWQCPSCGVAYAKAGDVGSAPLRASHEVSTEKSAGIPWGKLLLIAAIAYGGWLGIQGAIKPSSANAVGSIAARFGANPSVDQLAALAAATKPGDVLMYSAPWCSYCAAAKGWMNQYGFKYEECDIQASGECASELKRLGSEGVPYLIVKNHHMKDGFDSGEFIAALQKK